MTATPLPERDWRVSGQGQRVLPPDDRPRSGNVAAAPVGMTTGGYLERPAPSGLADVVETILQRGVVIDAYVRVSLVGIELLTIDARIVVASVDTYLRFAEAANRLELEEHGGRTLPDLLQQGVEETVETVAEDVVEDKVDDAIESVGDVWDKARDVVRRALPGKDS